MPTSFLPRRAAAWAVLAAAATVVCGAPAAVAAPGDNGDVKIHEVGTPFTDERNQPKVCDFYLDAFNFDTVQEVTWSIETQPSIPGGATRSGSITLTTGTGHTMPVAQLPNGMYKLTWNFVGENGAGKHKVFQVDCPSPPPGGSTGGSTGGGTGGTGGGTGGPNGGPPAGGGGLARDAALSPLAGAAAVGLTAVGGVVWFRLRRRPHGAS
ncbi:hypothetical protein OG824_42455 [Streptomyces prunicolor]|uniref:hypothetical protein n=1 Tax=Streptomyces prunicolor TaxID=67348 RepID=UPI002256A476|nr:hypothetical protein [Streptomyces prunicolor]MCX5241879.1 hypothetical protein [Streptomyces prunicolor]